MRENKSTGTRCGENLLQLQTHTTHQTLIQFGLRWIFPVLLFLRGSSPKVTSWKFYRASLSTYLLSKNKIHFHIGAVYIVSKA